MCCQRGAGAAGDDGVAGGADGSGADEGADEVVGAGVLTSGVPLPPPLLEQPHTSSAAHPPINARRRTQPACPCRAESKLTEHRGQTTFRSGAARFDA